MSTVSSSKRTNAQPLSYSPGPHLPCSRLKTACSGGPGTKLLLNPLDQEVATREKGESALSSQSEPTYHRGLRDSLLPLRLHHGQLSPCTAPSALFQSMGTFRFIFTICSWAFNCADSQLQVRVPLVFISLNGQASYTLRTTIPPH